MRISPEDMGDNCESFFRILCKSSALTVNNSKSDDKGGWDFTIEHPQRHTIVHDNNSYPVYRVQVKSTSCKSNNTFVTYSNLLNLIEFIGASFIFLGKYTGELNPTTAFLLHIDETFAVQIKKEIRKKQLSYKNFALNKHGKTISFKNNHTINIKDGTALYEALKTQTGDNFLDYIDSKRKYLEKLEKEGRSNIVNIQVTDINSLNSMARCFLGYDETFSAKTEMFRAPFGIPDEKPYYTKDNYLSKIGPIDTPESEVRITLRTSEFGKRYVFDGKVYVVPNFLPDELFQSRLKTSVFDFNLRGSDRNVSIQPSIFNLELSAPLREICDLCEFMDESQRSQTSYIKLETINFPNALELKLPPPTIDADDFFQKYLLVVKTLYQKLNALGLGNHKINFGHLANYVDNLLLLANSCSGTGGETSFCVDSRSIYSETCDSIVFHVIIELEGMSVIYFIAVFGQINTIEAGVIGVKYHSAKVVKEYLVEAADTDKIQNLIKEKHHQHSEELNQKGYDVFPGST